METVVSAGLTCRLYMVTQHPGVRHAACHLELLRQPKTNMSYRKQYSDNPQIHHIGWRWMRYSFYAKDRFMEAVVSAGLTCRLYMVTQHPAVRHAACHLEL
jgi:hypothetical protein